MPHNTPGQSIDATLASHEQRIAELEATVNALQAEADRRAPAVLPVVKQWHTRSEAAEYLRVSLAKVDRLRASGRLPANKLDKTTLFHLSDLESLVESIRNPELRVA